MRNKLILAGGLALILIFLFFQRRHVSSHTDAEQAANSSAPNPAAPAADQNSTKRTASRSAEASQLPAEQFVREKLTQFGRSRRSLAHGLAKKHGVDVPPEVERFFDAVESGDWDRIKTAFDALNGGDSSAGYNSGRSPEVNKLWPAIIDAFGVAQQVHLWPAQSLVDYGNSILESLRPGMVYAGGTDSSRWVPALLNDTSISSHIVITQNGLADAHYLDYVALQFEGRMQTLTHEESRALYQEYLKDLQKRFEHDQQNPNAPKQVLPGEEFKNVDGKMEASGRDAVFDMNQRLLKKLMEKNPELAFAIGESVPLTGTYADAVPIGHLMELNSKNEFTSERAAQSLDYWRQLSQNILSDAEALSSHTARRSYSHDTVAAGNLFAAHNFTAEAESAYLLARDLWPANPEVTGHLAELYTRTGRETDAQQLVDDFLAKHPDERANVKLVLGQNYSRYVDE